MKFGALRAPDGSWIGMDARPAAVRNFLAYSLTRLGVDHVDIYRPGRLDPNVPIEETIGAIADLSRPATCAAIGLSEVGPETIRRAHAVHPISDLQIEYSLISRGPEAKIFPLLSELGIGVTAYGVLSRGLLSGSRPAELGDFRAYLPRFRAENRERNEPLVDDAHGTRRRQGCSPRSSPSPGCWQGQGHRPPHRCAHPRRSSMSRSARSMCVALESPEQLDGIETALSRSAVAGTRYDEHQMRILDSERLS